MEERVELVRDHASEEAWLEQDKKAKRVYEHAAERIQTILEAKDHFGKEKQESGKENRAKARQRKSDLLKDLPNQTHPGGHRWSADKRGYRCQQCSLFVTSQTPYQELLSLASQACENSRPVVKGGRSQTRDEFLQQLLANQETDQDAPGHQWEITAHYLKCRKCGMQKLKRSRQETIDELLSSSCHFGKWTPPAQWGGHPSHKMWRKAGSVYCTQCHGKGLADGDTYKASARLKQGCKAGPQQNLRSFFKTEETAQVGYFWSWCRGDRELLRFPG